MMLATEDLSDEIRWLQRNGRTRFAYAWIRTDSGPTMHRPLVEVVDGQVLKAEALGDFSATEVIRAVYNAERRRQERRSRGAKKAAATRTVRKERATYRIAQALLDTGRMPGPRRTCGICRKRLDDATSIERGIGSECYQGVLAAITRHRAIGE